MRWGEGRAFMDDKLTTPSGCTPYRGRVIPVPDRHLYEVADAMIEALTHYPLREHDGSPLGR